MAGGGNGSMLGGTAEESADGEVMDDGEKFDRLEVERVMSQDPDSLAFHNAAKNVFRRTTVSPLSPLFPLSPLSPLSPRSLLTPLAFLALLFLFVSRSRASAVVRPYK